MLTLKELSALLEEAKCDFEIIAHPKPIVSTDDAAEFFDITKAAPVFILETDNGLNAFIVSSIRGRIDFNALKGKLGFQKLKMANPKKIFAETGHQVGAVPLTGHGLPVLFDKKLLTFDYIYGGTGDTCHTLKIKPHDLVRIIPGIKVYEF